MLGSVSIAVFGSIMLAITINYNNVYQCDWFEYAVTLYQTLSFFSIFVNDVEFTYESEALLSNQQVLSISRVQLSIQRLWVIPYDI